MSEGTQPDFCSHEVAAALTSVIEHVDAAAPDCAKRPPSRRVRRSCAWLVSDKLGSAAPSGSTAPLV